MLTNRAKYGLKALLVLAHNQGQGPLQAAVIAERERIPAKFLEVILLQLRNQGMIRSKVGKGGGHELARRPDEISLLQILRAIDGPVAPLPCLSHTAYSRCDDCADESHCSTRRLLALVHNATLEVMARTTLADAMVEGEPSRGLPGGGAAPTKGRKSAG